MEQGQAGQAAGAANVEPIAKGSQWALLRQRRFAPFFGTQLLGAFADSAVKAGVGLLATFGAQRAGGLSPVEATNLVAALFIAPFLLFSASAGQVADRFDKALVMRSVKLFEVAIMALAGWGFAGGHAWALFAAVFLMGAHSAFFGPAKYAYLPERLSERELVGGNGLVESGTFIAILLGTLGAGALMEAGGASAPRWMAFGCMGVSLLGLGLSLLIPRAKAAAPGLRVNWNPVGETLANLRLAKGSSRAVFLSLLAISFYWLLGSVLLAAVGPLSLLLGGGPGVSTLLLAMFSVGMALGALLCERLSRGRVEIGLTPLGALGMALFTADLAWTAMGWKGSGSGLGVEAFLAQPGAWRLCADMALLALFGGLYSVPLYALIQERSEPGSRSRVIAANNILNALFMVGGAALAIGAEKGLGLSVPQTLMAMALLTAFVGAYICATCAEFLWRFVAWVAVSCAYRVKSFGLGNVPERGPALIACNHVSFVDALALLAASPRPIRFLMDHRIFKSPVLGFVFRQVRAIPVCPKSEDPALYEAAFEAARAALLEGELVGIFPEGRITWDGEIGEFKGGAAKIVEMAQEAGVEVPVVPMALSGLWGSFFSREGGAAMRRPFRRGAFSEIGVSAGEPLKPGAWTAAGLRERVERLRGEKR